jgi:hypothetical protein
MLGIEINIANFGSETKRIDFVEKITEFLKLRQTVRIVTTGI